MNKEIEIPDGYEQITDDNYILVKGNLFLDGGIFYPVHDSLGKSYGKVKHSLSSVVLRKIPDIRFKTNKEYPYGY
jgi:hypothetical protein